MPFYEYQCNNCGHALEAMQKVSDPPLRKCPHCGKSQLQKLMSAPVFRLKGSGWYETDFKSDQDGKRNLADRPEAEAPKDEKKDKTEAKDAPVSDAAKADKAADKPADKPAAEKAAPADSAKRAPERGQARGGTAKKAARKAPSRPARAGKRSAAKSARRR
jgi:putative FmdB family regulatory protein